MSNGSLNVINHAVAWVFFVDAMLLNELHVVHLLLMLVEQTSEDSSVQPSYC